MSRPYAACVDMLAQIIATALVLARGKAGVYHLKCRHTNHVQLQLTECVFISSFCPMRQLQAIRSGRGGGAIGGGGGGVAARVPGRRQRPAAAHGPHHAAVAQQRGRGVALPARYPGRHLAAAPTGQWVVLVQRSSLPSRYTLLLPASQTHVSLQVRHWRLVHVRHARVGCSTMDCARFHLCMCCAKLLFGEAVVSSISFQLAVSVC